jgi:catechol 2,3-dioxygenase-like lactoylglutathione lyase family enzyme
MSEPLMDRIRMVTLRVRDLSRSLEWYKDRLGLNVLWHKEGTAGLQTKEEWSTIIILVEAADPDRFEREMIVHFTASDIRQAHQTLKSRQAAVEEIQTCRDVSAFCFIDPSGCAGMVWSMISPIKQHNEIAEVLSRFVPMLQ